MRQTRSPVSMPDLAQPFGQFVVVGEQAGIFGAERDHDRAGQRCEIDHEFRLELLRHVPEHVGQHQAAFGVGVDDLDGLARHRGDDIAGALRVAVGHVLDQADGADRVDLGLARGQRMHQPDHAGRAAHVALHVLHAGGALDRNAAGIEANALADEGDRLLAFLAAVPAHDHGAARLRGALRDAEQRAHAELRHRLDVEHLDIDAELARAGSRGARIPRDRVRSAAR